MAIYIYGLLCPIDGRIRYIGKSINPAKRLSAHISSAITNAYSHHTSRWIRRLAGKGLSPELKILDVVNEGQDWRECERGWIARGINEGWPLTNSTAGGEGLDYLDPAEKAKYLDNLAVAMKRYRTTPEWDKAKARLLKFSQSAETIKKRNESISESAKRPEFIQLMREVNSEIGSRPEVKAKKSAKSKAMWSDQEQRARIEKALSLPGCKAKQSKARKAAWADPVLGAKLREIHNSDQVRAKKSASAKARATPEYRAMMAEKTRLSWEHRRNANKGSEVQCE